MEFNNMVPTLMPTPASDFVEPSVDDRYSYVLECVEEQQEDLRDAREALLGSRFRLQVQRRELAATREMAASKAGAAFNFLRRYLAKIAVDAPSDIESALCEAETLRNRLGEQEVDYDEAEKVYDLEEWGYTTEEEKFMNQLRSSAPPPSQSGYPNFPITKHMHEDPGRIILGPQDIANMVAESEGGINLPFHGSKMHVESESDLSGSQPTVSGDIFEPSPSYDGRESPAIEDLDAYSVKELLFEELVNSHARLDWKGTRRNIDEWLLRSLDTSRLEQGRLKHHSMVELDLNHEEWWDLTGQLWFSDTPEERAFHTGDTTVSEESRSQPFSINAISRRLDVIENAGSETQWFPSIPVRVLGQVVDAPELAEFPADIEPRDLIDISSRHRQEFDPSLSTNSRCSIRTTLTRHSSSLDCSSISPSEQKSDLSRFWDAYGL